MNIQSLFVFSKGMEISPFCLVYAQSPLAGTIISYVRYYKGAYYLQIDHNTEAQINGYLEKIRKYMNVDKKASVEDKEIYYVSEKE